MFPKTNKVVAVGNRMPNEWNPKGPSKSTTPEPLKRASSTRISACKWKTYENLLKMEKKAKEPSVFAGNDSSEKLVVERSAVNKLHEEIGTISCCVVLLCYLLT